MKERASRAIATALGLILLVTLVCAVAYFFVPDEQFWFAAIVGLLFMIPFGLFAWNGSLSKRGSTDKTNPPSWQEWTGIFILSFFTSALFIAIDVAVVHPGLSLLFTITAIAMTFISLPGALRAWILKRLVSH